MYSIISIAVFFAANKRYSPADSTYLVEAHRSHSRS